MPRPEDQEAAAEFDLFWQAYPRKQAKKDAVKAWRQTTARRPEFPVLMRALVAASTTDDWQKANGSYVPYAASWLRGERWNDQLGLSGVAAVGPASAPSLWRRLTLLLPESEFKIVVMRWTMARWVELDLVISLTTPGMGEAALLNCWPDLCRIAAEYDVTLKME